MWTKTYSHCHHFYSQPWKVTGVVLCAPMYFTNVMLVMEDISVCILIHPGTTSVVYHFTEVNLTFTGAVIVPHG